MAKNRRQVEPALIQPPGTRMPKGERELKFCEFWLTHFDHVRAYKQAGYSTRNHQIAERSLAVYRRLAPYLEKLRAEKAKELAKRQAIRENDVLDEIVALAFANAKDYVEAYEAEEIVEVEGQKQKQIVTRHRRKPLSELTRAQAAAITRVEFHANGTVTYDLPEPKDKRPALELIGKNFGMFDQRLIAEHRHVQQRRSAELKDIEPDKLKIFEDALIEAMGPQAARAFIGYTPEVEEESDAP